jgi:hypothetical protein
MDIDEIGLEYYMHWKTVNQISLKEILGKFSRIDNWLADWLTDMTDRQTDRHSLTMVQVLLGFS